MSNPNVWDTDLRIKGMKFYMEWDQALHETKLYGPRAPGHSWEGPILIKFKANDFAEAMRKSEQFVEMKFK